MIIMLSQCNIIFNFRKIKEEKKYSREFEGIKNIRLNEEEEIEINNVEVQAEVQDESIKEKNKLSMLFNNEIKQVELKKEEKKINIDEFPDLDLITNEQDISKKKDSKGKSKKKKFTEVNIDMFKNIGENQSNIEKPKTDPKNKIKK